MTRCSVTSENPNFIRDQEGNLLGLEARCGETRQNFSEISGFLPTLCSPRLPHSGPVLGFGLTRILAFTHQR